MMRFPKLLAFAAGLISATGFAPLELWPLTLVALAAMMWLVADAPNLRGALARGYAFGLGHFIVGLNWIAGAFRYQETMPVWLGWVAVVALAIYIAVYPAMAAGLAWRWGKPRTPLASGESPSPARGEGRFALVFAASWIATEHLRATMFTGFAWNPLGVALVPTPGDGLAKLIGTYGVSACVILIAGALVHARRLVAFPAALAVVLGAGWLTTLSFGEPGRTDRVMGVEALDPMQPHKALLAVGEQFLALAREEQTLGKFRSLYGAANVQPDACRACYRQGPGRLNNELATYLQRANDAGTLKVKNPRLAADLFLAMFLGDGHIRGLLMLEMPDARANSSLLREAVRVFLAGYGVGA